MPQQDTNPLIQPAIRIAADALGAAVAGPLGLALGGFAADALGRPAADLVRTCLGKFGDATARKLLDSGADDLAGRLKQAAPDLEALYRDALRLSLAEMHAQSEPGFDDWFVHWDVCLHASVPLQLEPVQPGQLAPDSLSGLVPQDLLRRTMERLDAQGDAIQRQSQSLLLDTRSIPDPLLAQLEAGLPGRFKQQFGALIVTPRYSQAWNQAGLAFRDWLATAIARMDETLANVDRKTEALPRIEDKIDDLARQAASQTAFDEGFLARYDDAIRKGLIAELKVRELEAEKARQAEELRKLQSQLAARSSEPGDADLSRLLDQGNLDDALRLKAQQVQTCREQAARLPRDLFELGTIHELRFEWPQALDAFRQAWELGRNPEHGFKYAWFAQKLNRFKDAIDTYEALLLIYADSPGRALAFNNLAILYRDTQRIPLAQHDFTEALVIYRKLAEDNRNLYLPSIASTLNNLANLYSDIAHLQGAEQLYNEALDIQRELAEENPEAYLPGEAMMLNNLALLYSATQRIPEAGKAFGEALGVYRGLAARDANTYQPYVAMTLNNLASFYRAKGSLGNAQEACNEALEIRRNLAKANPGAYLPDLASTLNNLANLLSATDRPQEAEEAYREALAIRRSLAALNPDAFLPDVAGSLNNLAYLCLVSGRIQEAEAQAAEAETILGPLWKANPELLGNLMARNLWTRALVAEANRRPAAEASAFARRALAAAFDPSFKQDIQQLIDRLGPEPTG